MHKIMWNRVTYWYSELFESYIYISRDILDEQFQKEEDGQLGDRLKKLVVVWLLVPPVHDKSTGTENQR